MVKYIQRKNPEIKHVEIEPKNDEIIYWNESEKIKRFKDILVDNIDPEIEKLIQDDIRDFIIREEELERIGMGYEGLKQ